jgi:hypothetical protein
MRVKYSIRNEKLFSSPNKKKYKSKPCLNDRKKKKHISSGRLYYFRVLIRSIHVNIWLNFLNEKKRKTKHIQVFQGIHRDR